MTVGAQSSYRIGFAGLRMGVVARLALDARLAVFTRTPFVGGRLMAGLTQIRIRRDRHALSRVLGLEWAVASLARHALLSVTSCAGIETCGVALQAARLLVKIFPVALEDRGGECPGMACVHPGSVDVFVVAGSRVDSRMEALPGPGRLQPRERLEARSSAAACTQVRHPHTPGRRQPREAVELVR